MTLPRTLPQPRRDKFSLSLLLIALLLLGFGVPVPAATVYKSVDENGVVNYSDKPPAGEQPVEVLEIDATAPELTETEQQRLDALRETTDRMVADRERREKHRAELRQQQGGGQAQAVDNPGNAEYPGSYPAGYYPYPIYRPGAGWGRPPRPGHPVVRPPLRPGPPGTTPGVRPIPPGYDYPASLIRRGYSPEVRAAFEK